MRGTRWALLTLALLVGCGQETEPTSYDFEGFEMTREEFRAELDAAEAAGHARWIAVEWAEPDELARAGEGVEGLAVWGDPECLILLRRPTGWDDSEVLRVAGHELLHCLGLNHW